jgi:plastocyanin
MGLARGGALALAGALTLLPSGLSAGKAHQVSMEAMKYAPEALEVAVGDTVTWTNRDPVPHTVSAGKSIESGTIDVDGSWRHVAKQKGQFEYICRFHPGMRAKLVVK